MKKLKSYLNFLKKKIKTDSLFESQLLWTMSHPSRIYRNQSWKEKAKIKKKQLPEIAPLLIWL